MVPKYTVSRIRQRLAAARVTINKGSRRSVVTDKARTG